jgi:hypothetical protein
VHGYVYPQGTGERLLLYDNIAGDTGSTTQRRCDVSSLLNEAGFPHRKRVGTTRGGVRSADVCVGGNLQDSKRKENTAHCMSKERNGLRSSAQPPEGKAGMCGLDETERSSVQREHTQALYTSHPPRRSGSSQVQTWNLQLVFINIIKSHYHGI